VRDFMTWDPLRALRSSFLRALRRIEELLDE
jgi:hypothetical protein